MKRRGRGIVLAFFISCFCFKMVLLSGCSGFAQLSRIVQMRCGDT